ncbi:hypothetical protein Dimus_008405, partial [Dionaea muscipula]
KPDGFGQESESGRCLGYGGVRSLPGLRVWPVSGVTAGVRDLAGLQVWPVSGV